MLLMLGYGEEALAGGAELGATGGEAASAEVGERRMRHCGVVVEGRRRSVVKAGPPGAEGGAEADVAGRPW